MPIYSKDILAADVRALRVVRKMTLAELSAKTGLSVSFLNDIEHGRTNPSLSTLEKIATAYGMHVCISFEFSRISHRPKKGNEL